MKALQKGHLDEVEAQYTARNTQATQEAQRRQLVATTATKRQQQSNTQEAQMGPTFSADDEAFNNLPTFEFSTSRKRLRRL
eukprot:9469635-Pyramimonas_sp.AAC.1